ncbi:GFA family protein [Rugamonas rubra]|uniref:Uncharacterized conserved protein n=1 Tax=Rugamonas rubra TaxID=758825 RepID=A0A1I4IQE4_9BURK|nr:GFA family protein [Rugamonas rubra]SFL55986.1 Uncharacterized conserved protein [Rugamonas rubra]
MSIPATVACLCGKVELALGAAPQARANCHCASCRDFYATPMLAASAWAAADVRVVKGELRRYAHPDKQMSRAFCADCGELMFGINRLGMTVLPNGLAARAAGGALPPALAPQMHLFYAERVLEVADALPKYLQGWDGPLLAD